MGSIEDNASEEQYGPAILFFSAATFAKKGLWGLEHGGTGLYRNRSREYPLNKKRGNHFKLGQDIWRDFWMRVEELICLNTFTQ